MRLFLGWKLTPESRDLLVEAWKGSHEANPRHKWVAPDNLHVTFAFLGQVSEDDLKACWDQLRNLSVPSPNFCWAGPGQFPAKGPARTLYQGLITVSPSSGEALPDVSIDVAARRTLGRPADWFSETVSTFRSSGLPKWFSSEIPRTRDWVAHITVCRAREGVPFHAVEIPYLNLVGQVCPVEPLQLFESKTLAAGPEYRALHTF